MKQISVILFSSEDDVEYKFGNDIVIRFAYENDVGVILQFIKELAKYEGMLEQVSANENILRKTIFTDKKAEVLLSLYEEKPIGFALFFHNFSTFLGKPGIYLEDLYVREEMRNKGIGKKLLSVLAKIAIERDCGRLEWWCLDWNKKSIEFYLGIGADAMYDWTVYRLKDTNLLKLAEEIDTKEQ
jgi:GNAT superfamily N-acetyltransferase